MAEQAFVGWVVPVIAISMFGAEIWGIKDRYQDAFYLSTFFLLVLGAAIVVRGLIAGGAWIAWTAISQGSIVGIAVVLSVVSYRYAVKSNARNAVSQQEPLKFDDYRIEPTVHAVKWRPRWAELLPIFGRAGTSLRFRLYVDDGRTVRPADMRRLGLSETDFDSLEALLPEDEAIPPGFQIGNASIERNGLSIRVLTASGVYLALVTDRALRKIYENVTGADGKLIERVADTSDLEEQ